MRTLINVFVIVCLISSQAFGDCDWTKIKKNADRTYTFSEELYLCVGKLVEDNKTKDQQIKDMTKAISLKDLSIQEADKKATLWNDTAEKLESRLEQIDKLDHSTDWLYFLLGVGVTGVAAYAASSLKR